MRILFKNAEIIDVIQEKTLKNHALISNAGVISHIGHISDFNQELFDQEIDLNGMYLLPGLINCHTHLLSNPMQFVPQQFVRDDTLLLDGITHAKQHLQAGFTFVRDMGGRNYVDVTLKNAIKEGKCTGPSMMVSGRALTITGGHGSINGIECDGPDAFIKGARETIKQGADLVKIMVTGGVLSQQTDPSTCPMWYEEIEAAVKTAQLLGKTSAAHIHSALGIKHAVRAGITSVEHGTLLDQECIELMLQHQTTYVPTLLAPFSIVENAAGSLMPQFMIEKAKRLLETHHHNFRSALDHNVKIAVGTDSGTPYNHHSIPMQELMLMYQNGMKPMSVLRSATIIAAQLLGIASTHGSINIGKQADFIVLEKDPLVDFNQLLSIKKIYKSAQLI